MNTRLLRKDSHDILQTGHSSERYPAMNDIPFAHLEIDPGQ